MTPPAPPSPAPPSSAPPSSSGSSSSTSDLAQRALGSASWSAIGTAVMFASSVVSTVVLARLVEPAAFGVVAVAVACATLLRALVLWSPAQALVRCEPLRPAHLAAGTALALAGGLLGATVLLGLSLAPPVTGGAASTWAFRGMALTLVVQAVGTVPTAILQRDLHFRRLSAIQAVSSVVGFCGVGLGLATAGAGVGALVGAQLAQATIEAVGVLAAGRAAMTRPSLRSVEAAELFAFSRRLCGVSAGAAVAQQGDNLVVGAALGATPLGLYSRAFRLMALPANLFGDATDWVLLPVLSRLRDDQDRLGRGLRQTTTVLAVTVLPLSATACLLGEEVVAVLLGDRWSGAVTPFRILCLGMFLRVAYKPATVVLKATGEVRTLARVMAAYAALVLGGALVGQRWGLAGVAVTTVVALAACYVGVTVAACRSAVVAARSVVDSLALGAFLTLLTVGLVLVVATAARAAGLPDVVVLVAGASATAAVVAGAVASPLAAAIAPELAWWRSVARTRLGFVP